MSDSHVAWQETVDLPVGLPDEEGHLLRRATLRKMTGKEEALLADPRLRSNGGKLISALLANCITAVEGLPRVDTEATRRLFSADRNYLLLELRRLTFGDEMEARYRCTRCGETSVVMEDLRALDVRRFEDGATPEVHVTLRDGYRDPDGRWHHDFVFGLPTGEDEEAAGARRDQNPSRARDALLARCLKQVGTLEAPRVAGLGVRILADLSMADRRTIQKALDDGAPGPDLTRTITCDRCGEDFRTTLDMSQFFPLG